jgi:hypothetical protein
MIDMSAPEPDQSWKEQLTTRVQSVANTTTHITRVGDRLSQLSGNGRIDRQPFASEPLANFSNIKQRLPVAAWKKALRSEVTAIDAVVPEATSAAARLANINEQRASHEADECKRADEWASSLRSASARVGILSLAWNRQSDLRDLTRCIWRFGRAFCFCAT